MNTDTLKEAFCAYTNNEHIDRALVVAKHGGFSMLLLYDADAGHDTSQTIFQFATQLGIKKVAYVEAERFDSSMYNDFDMVIEVLPHNDDQTVVARKVHDWGIMEREYDQTLPDHSPSSITPDYFDTPEAMQYMLDAAITRLRLSGDYVLNAWGTRFEAGTTGEILSIVKIAQVIAHIARAETVQLCHVAEAIQYHSLRGGWEFPH